MVHPLLSLVALALLLHPLRSASTPQQVAPTAKYCQSGTQVFATAGYYGTANNNINPLLYTITFPTAMNDSSYKSGIAIQQIYADLPNGSFNLTFMLSFKSPGSLNFNMWSNTMDCIKSMTIRYLVIASSWWGALAFYWAMQSVGAYLSSSNSFSYTNTALASVNMTGTVNSFSCLTGFDVTATTSANELSLVHSVTRDSATSIAATLSSLSSVNVYVTYISYNLLTYNVGQIAALPGRITFGTFSGSTAGAVQYTDTTLIVRPYNNLFGIVGFHINNQNFLSWTGLVTTNTSISISSSNNFLYFQFIYIILQENWCIDATPYLLIATATCYDICPDGYYPNPVGLTCEICLYDCYQCTNSSVCSTCNATTDNRQMNTTTSRCDPLPGYYDTGLSQAVAPACSATCLTCATTSTKCTTCPAGTYLSGTTCKACSATNCNNCTTSSSCFACLTPYSLSGSACILNCSLAVTNCSTCTPSPTVTCTLCAAGYFLNTTNNTCSIICGDGILASSQQCDDGNNVAGDGCSSTCTIQPAFYCSGAVGSKSSCSNCISNCLNCTSSTNCSLCATNYQFNSTSTACEANCSVVTNCVTCSVVSGGVVCSTCVTGYVVDSSNTCVTKCGDGIIIGAEQCDDNNTADGDGCSSTCTIEPAFFCQSTPSACYPCLTYCLSCVDNVSCSSCDTLAPWNSTTLSCAADCSQVSNCATCSITNANTVGEFIQCTGCVVGFSVNMPANSCATICGDGLVLGSQGCDDGNSVNGDGCSSVCTVEAAYYCLGAPSVCSSCLQYCNNCTSASNCQSCNSITTWNPTASTCAANCSSITYCLTCQVSSAAGADSIQCLTCSGGYSVNPATNTCMPICGDGILAPEEQCDDGNLNDGDGCSSACQVQQYYSCNASPATLASQCFLSALNISLVDITKDNGQNSGVMNFQPSPASLPIYSSVDWSSIISVQNSNVEVISATYDPATNIVKVDFNYSSSIQASQVQFSINTTNNPQLSGVTPFNVSLKATADDNQALEYYSQSDYSMGKIVKYLALAAAGCSVLFLIAGIFGGRLVSLECAGVIQLAFISTLNLQNLSPTFSCLSSLSWSLGYNKLKPYDYSSGIDRAFKAAQFSQKLIQNYNAMAALIFVPMLLAIILKIVSKTRKDASREQYWNSKAKHCLGEFTFYVLLSFSYLGFLSLFIEIKYINSSAMDYMGIGAGLAIAALSLVYLFFYARADSFYTEFKQKFEADSFSSKFYIFVTLQRILVPAVLVQMVGKIYGNAAIIGIYALLGILLVVKKPYKGEKQNYRPFANYLIVVLIQGIYMGVNFMQDPTGMLSIYGPLIVLGLLFVCVGYSAYALGKALKESCSKSEAEKAQQMEQAKLQQIQMKQFTAKLLNEQTKGILQQDTFYPVNQRKGSDSLMLEASPQRMDFSGVKQQLMSLKRSQADNNSLDLAIQPENISKILGGMEQDI